MMVATASTKTDLAREALAAARRVRIRAGASAESPICIYDLVDEHYRDEIELRFKAAPSLEGLYVRGEPSAGSASIIIVSALRPAGRQRSTCAHELAHHLFGHGSSIDQVVEDGTSLRFEPNEHLANAFAAFLTMPKLGILKAFTDRDTRPEQAPPTTVYAVASQFGVGFTTLVHHLWLTLGALSAERARHLLRVTPKRMREELLGALVPGELVLFDQHWRGRAVDLAIGDHLVVPAGATVEADTLKFLGKRSGGDAHVAVRVGRGRVIDVDSGNAAYVRVSRPQYEGRAMFRHLEESDDE
jgi:hypothetical protein